MTVDGYDQSDKGLVATLKFLSINLVPIVVIGVPIYLAAQFIDKTFDEMAEGFRLQRLERISPVYQSEYAKIFGPNGLADIDDSEIVDRDETKRALLQMKVPYHKDKFLKPTLKRLRSYNSDLVSDDLYGVYERIR